MSVMKRILPIGAILFLLLSACSRQNANNVPDNPTDSEQPTIQLPTSEMYSLEGVDAEIFDAVAQFVNEDDPESNICIPVLNLVGEYGDNNGNTCYIVKCHMYIYFDLKDALDDASEVTKLVPGEEISWVCVTLSDSGHLVDIQGSQDGNMWSESIIKLCGPLIGLANDIIDNIDPVSIREFPEVNQEQLAQTYVEAIADHPT